MTDNPAFVRSLYDAFGRGDMETIIDNVDPAIEWVSHISGETVPWGGRRSGRAGVASFFQAIGENLDFEAFEPRQFLDSGDAVTVLGRTRARFKGDGGGMFDSEWVHIFMIRDGKVARFQEYYDTAEIERALAA